MQKSKRLISCLLLVFVSTLYSWPKEMVVTASVADLRNECSVATDLTHSKPDAALLSQLLFGEQVIAEKEVDGYLRVSAIGQQIYSNEKNDFIGCPGWIKSDQAIEVENFDDYNLAVKEPYAFVIDESDEERRIRVLLGTRLCGERVDEGLFDVVLQEGKGFIDASKVVFYDEMELDEEALRRAICDVARLFLGHPYTWGGRSIYDDELEEQGQLTGCDCSNLVALCYKVYGIDIPRNTRSQHKKCKLLDFGKELKPGDVVFTAKKGLLGYKIGHVMLCVGNDEFIEAVGGKVRKVIKIKGAERFGKSVNELAYGDVTNCGKVYFGSFLSNV